MPSGKMSIRFDNNIWRIDNGFAVYRIGLKDNRVYHLGFFPAGEELPEDLAWNKLCSPLQLETVVSVNNEGRSVSHGSRYVGCGASDRAEYIGHTMGSNRLMIRLRDSQTGLEIELHYEIFPRSPALRRFTRVRNTSEKPILLQHLSSYLLAGFPYFTDHGDGDDLYLHTFHSEWCWEGTHRCRSLRELGVLPRSCRYAWHFENISSWVCQEMVPFAVLEERRNGLFWAVQLEYSAPWRMEVGGGGLEAECFAYITGGMQNHLYGSFEKRVNPGESFDSPPASLAAVRGELDDCLNAMQLHRQLVLIHRQQADEILPVVYNEWQETFGGVCEKSVDSHLEVLREAGVECYVLDCGWYADQDTGDDRSDWWLTPGDWIASPKRFPHGLAAVAEKIRSKGMIPGIWCEIEAVGRYAAFYEAGEAALMRRNGSFVEDCGRRFLCFAEEAGRKRADEVLESLISQGFRYFKIDYNIDSAPGCDNAGDSPGNGQHQHLLGYYSWLEALRSRHPEVIIENCSSGGMRLEYGMLSRTDLASITDNEDSRNTGNIFYGVSRYIHPSQMGNWSALRSRFEDHQYVMTLINSMCGRMHISGDVQAQSQRQRALLREAVAFYKSYRHILHAARLYHLSDDVGYCANDGVLILQINAADDSTILLAVWRLQADTDHIKLPPLRGIDPSAAYRLTAFPACAPAILKGAELAEKLTVDLPVPYFSTLLKLDRQ